MDNMNDLVNSIKDFPAMPNIIMRALNIMKDPESSAKGLADIISFDQSLSTKVLTLVNSAYYGFPQQITSIHRALALMGMSKAKNIIFTVAMRPMLINQADKELWKHSIRTAVGCEHLAKHLKIMDSDEAFVIGFLHDLGKMVLCMKDATLCQKIKELTKTGANVIETERLFFGTDHCQMGSLLAKKWQLPLLIANAIKYHHTPSLSPMPVASTLVYLIDILVQDNFEVDKLDKKAIETLNIKIEQPEILRESIFAKANLLLNELST
jgi:putative nucleotidyltransferase with HDIG domain